MKARERIGRGRVLEKPVCVRAHTFFGNEISSRERASGSPGKRIPSENKMPKKKITHQRNAGKKEEAPFCVSASSNTHVY